MPPFKLLTCEQSRELDRKTIDLGYASGEELMRRAGKAIAVRVMETCRIRNFSKEILLLAGKGNNGGDAFVVAFYLHQSGFDPKILLTTPTESIRAEALVHFKKLEKLPIPVACALKIQEIRMVLNQFKGDVIVDGLLGTGFTPPLSDYYQEVIRMINQTNACILSIDIPSGLSCIKSDSPVIMADQTLSLGTVKDVLVSPGSIDYSGRVIPVDIGFPTQLVNEFYSNIHVFDPADCRLYLHRRLRSAHKGSFGHVLVAGGSFGMSGAAILSAYGALRAGCGRVSVYTEKESRPIVHSVLPEAMTVDFDHLVEKWRKRKSNELRKALEIYSVLCIGPGLGKSSRALHLLKALGENFKGSVVMDADALNLLSLNPEVIKVFSQEKVLTPHPGEAARLLGFTTRDVEADRVQAIMNLQKKYNSTILLKGANSLVSDSGVSTLHLTGTPAMAQGGMGDVLSGIIASFMGQGLLPYDASNLGVCLHGLCAEYLEEEKGPFGFMAKETADILPFIVKKLGRFPKKSL